jgi:calreticulin
MISLFFASLSSSTFFLKETFDTGTFNNWHVPKKLLPFTKLGKWAVSTGDCYGHQQKWLGLTTTQSHRDYILYTSFIRPMNTTERDFVLSYTLRMNPFVDCSGQFVKIMDSNSDMNRFNKELPFAIKFGPDICGPSFKRTHVVIMYKGKEYETNRPIGVIKDPFTHSYTLIIRKNNSYAVLIDGEIADESTLEERFNFTQNEHKATKDSVETTRQKSIQGVEIGEEDDDDINDAQEHLNNDEPTQVAAEKVEEEVSPNDSPEQVNNDEPTQTAEEEGVSLNDSPEQANNDEPTQAAEEEEEVISIKDSIDNEEDDDDFPPFGHFESLGYLGIDVHQSCCGSLFDNFVVTDSVKEAMDVLRDNFLYFREQEAQNCDKGGSGGGGSGGESEEGNDDHFVNKEQIMEQYAHKIDFSNFDPL